MKITSTVMMRLTIYKIKSYPDAKNLCAIQIFFGVAPKFHEMIIYLLAVCNMLMLLFKLLD